MFHNPAKDFLYLPEFASGQKRVTIYDSEGIYRGTLSLDLPSQQLDKIWKLILCEDSSLVVVLSERIGWEPYGKFYVTQNKISIKHFNKKGEFLSDIFKLTMDEELSHAPRYGEPRIFFLPSLLVKLTPIENILVAKTDENFLTIFDNKGHKIKTIELDIAKEKLSEGEFQREKNLIVGLMSDERMKYLARNMIKLDYKPIYSNMFLERDHIILTKATKRDENYSVTESELIFFDWNGKMLKSKKIKGQLMNTKKDKLFIKIIDPDMNEHFKITTDKN